MISDINKIVKKIVKKWKQIMTISEISMIITGKRAEKYWEIDSFVTLPTEESKGYDRVYQIIYQLKWMGVLLSIRNGLYFIPSNEKEKSLHIESIIDKYYWYIVRSCIVSEVGNEWIIAWEKSLELHMNDRSVPFELLIYTRDTNKRITIWEGKVIILRSIVSGKKTGSKNMFPFLYKNRERIEMDGWIFSFLGREASILDALTIHNQEYGVNNALILKFIRRYESLLMRDVFWKLVTQKYIRPINRLREISKYHGIDTIYHMTLEIIRDEGGGCFLTME